MFGVFTRMFGSPSRSGERNQITNQLVANHGIPIDPQKKYIPIMRNGLKPRQIHYHKESTRNSGAERYARVNASNKHDVRPGGKRPINRDSERAHEGIKSTPTVLYGMARLNANRSKHNIGGGVRMASSAYGEERLNGDLDRAPRARQQNKKPVQANVPAGIQINLGLPTHQDDKLYADIGPRQRATPATTPGNSIRRAGPMPAQTPIY